jgi:hypothetical protein
VGVKARILAGQKAAVSGAFALHSKIKGCTLFGALEIYKERK